MASLLIVDDDETVRDTLTELFSGEHLCKAAATAEDALALLASPDLDLIITDISMPGMSGEDLLGFVKTYRPRTPVVFITGSGGRENAERLMNKGAVGYLTKPFRLEEIEAEVERALERRART